MKNCAYILSAFTVFTIEKKIKPPKYTKAEKCLNYGMLSTAMLP